MKNHFVRIFFIALSMLYSAATYAQAYPGQPIRMVVPFPPGGGTDLISRELAAAITKTAGWSVVVDNRPGAGGNLGVDAAVKSKPDGYTVVMGQTSNLAINPTLYSKLPYDPFTDLTPVVLVASSPLVLVVPATSPYKTLDEMIRSAKSQPGALNFASSGNGTVAHLAFELLQQVAGIKAQHIPYKGFNLAFNDLVSGQVQLFMSSVPTALGQIRSGKLRALAVTSKKRSDELPDVPTIDESGFPGFEAITWFGLMAPAKTPVEIVAALNKEANAAMATEAFQAKLRSEGAIVRGGSTAELAQLLKHDYAMWSKVVKTSGAKVD